MKKQTKKLKYPSKKKIDKVQQFLQDQHDSHDISATHHINNTLSSAAIQRGRLVVHMQISIGGSDLKKVQQLLGLDKQKFTLDNIRTILLGAIKTHYDKEIDQYNQGLEHDGKPLVEKLPY